MNHIIAGAALALTLALASAAVPATASEATTMKFECPDPDTKPAQSPDLSGSWDLVMDVGGNPSFGLLSVGRSGAGFAGSIALNAGVAVARSLTFDGQVVALIVATGEGDVRFDGSLASDGKRMCGIVSYHGGQKYGMIAQKRPSRATGAANSGAGQGDARR